MNRRFFVLLVAGLSLGFAPAPVPKTDGKSELKKLNGTWSIVSRTIGRRPPVRGGGAALRPVPPRPAPVRPNLKVVIAGDRWKFTLGERTTAEYTLVVRPGKKPKEVDLKGVKRNINLFGIYRLQGDTLTISYSLSSNGRPAVRPKDFTEGGSVAMTLKREKR
jgi:uncharacterized protein (TIGR03067 family)